MTNEEPDGGPNSDQAAYWNSPAGEKWALHADALDAALAGATDLLLRAASPQPGEAVLDVGCGTGATAEAFAAAVGPAGRVVGVDISRSQIAAAQARPGTRVAYRLGDAQTDAFADAPFDLVTSRFGMMFFADPVAAFANIAGAMRPGGRLVFATWAPFEANPWFHAARAAAEARLGAWPAEVPGAPGPFGLAEADRGLAIMAEAGFVEAAARQEDFRVLLGTDLPAAARFTANFGPVARMMRERGGTEADLAAIVAAVEAAFAGYVAGGEVRVPATLNVFSAIRPG